MSAGVKVEQPFSTGLTGSLGSPYLPRITFPARREYHGGSTWVGTVLYMGTTYVTWYPRTYPNNVPVLRTGSVTTVTA